MPEGLVQVGVVEKNLNPYWDTVNAGWWDAGGRLGLDLDFRAPLHQDLDAQRALMWDVLERGVDALAFVGTVDDAFDDICLAARDRGVTVVTFDLDASRDFRSLFVGMLDPETIGRRVGARIAEEVGAGAIVILQAGSSYARGAVGKLRGLTTALTAAGIVTVTSEPDGEDLDLARDQAQQMFRRHPGAAAAIGVYGYHPAVLAAAASAAGSTAHIHGFDLLPETVALLQEGRVASSEWIREYQFGYLTAVAVHDLVRLGSDEVLELYGGVADGAGISIEIAPRTVRPDDVHEYVRWREAHPSLDRPRVTTMRIP